MNDFNPQFKLKFQGLTTEEVKSSRLIYGSNIISTPAQKTAWKLYLEKFDDPIIRILTIAAIIATGTGLIKGNYLEGVAIIFTIILATFLSFLNEYKARNEFDLLIQAKDDVSVKAVRNRVITTIPRGELVKGDVVLLETGDEIPADGILLEAVSFHVDESRISGESFPIPKTANEKLDVDDRENNDDFSQNAKVYRATMVMEGHGIAKITAVGNATEAGKATKAATEDFGQTTPLMQQLEKLGNVISFFGIAGAVSIFFALVARGIYDGELRLNSEQGVFAVVFFISAIITSTRIWIPLLYGTLEQFGIEVTSEDLFTTDGVDGWLTSIATGIKAMLVMLIFGSVSGLLSLQPLNWIAIDSGTILLKYFMVVVAVIVVAVPEGLGMAVTLCLAYGMRRMMAANNLVRRLHACETIGAATVICSDKTGTLTRNEMVVEEAAFPKAAPMEFHELLRSDIGKLITEGICVNSTAHLCKKPGCRMQSIGNITEGAILEWLADRQVDYLFFRNNFMSEKQWTFTADRKFMATAGYSRILGKRLMYIKGAPEIVLNRCSRIISETEETSKPLAENLTDVEQLLENYQRRGMRTLGFAYKELSRDDVLDPDSCSDIEEISRDLVWLGCIAIIDPIRSEVVSALKACFDAGIQVKMVTGDNPRTAVEVAGRVGLLNAQDGSEAHICGAEFMKLSDSQAQARLRNLKILSRAKPMDKLRLVSLLKESGHVVAVTGDGVNDAPALNRADVGLAMGKTGTDIAKEASDIVLLDDSFVSITNAILWGRALFLNIRRFLVYQLTINVAALGLTLLGPILGLPLPLTILQMLWVNLIMDTLAALALATEPPTSSLMNKPPRNNNDFIISPDMAKSILSHGIFFIVFFLGFLNYHQNNGNLSDYQLSVFFTLFVFCQFWNLFNVRRFGIDASAFDNISANPWFIFVASVIVIGQFFIVQFGGTVFRTTPISAYDWFLLFAGSSPILLIPELLRFFNGSSTQASLNKQND